MVSWLQIEDETAQLKPELVKLTILKPQGKRLEMKNNSKIFIQILWSFLLNFGVRSMPKPGHIHWERLFENKE
jgi:hypothetical protein